MKKPDDDLKINFTVRCEACDQDLEARFVTPDSPDGHQLVLQVMPCETCNENRLAIDDDEIDEFIDSDDD